MLDTNEYVVELEDQGPGGPDASLRERFATCAGFRLRQLERRAGHYPRAGGALDIMDGFEGKFVWEASDEELAESPMSIIDLEVVSVEPPFRPDMRTTVRVVARVLI